MWPKIIKKAYDKVDGEAFWDVLKFYGVGGQLMEKIKGFYRQVHRWRA